MGEKKQKNEIKQILNVYNGNSLSATGKYNVQVFPRAFLYLLDCRSVESVRACSR